MFETKAYHCTITRTVSLGLGVFADIWSDGDLTIRNPGSAIDMPRISARKLADALNGSEVRKALVKAAS